MLLNVLLSQHEIAIINDSRALHNTIVHSGYELSMLVARTTAEEIRTVLPTVRADKSERNQIGWKISSETNERIIALAVECRSNKTEIVRSVIMLRGLEMAAPSESETGCKACDCISQAPRIDPNRFILTALSADNREGDILPVQRLASAILSLSERPELVVISRWNPAALGSSEFRDIMNSYYEILESRFRPSPLENGFMLLYKNRFKYAMETSGSVPGVFFPVHIKDIMSKRDVLIIAIDSEETQEERIEDVKKRFCGTEKIIVWGDEITAVSNGVSIEALELSGVIRAVIKYKGE